MPKSIILACRVVRSDECAPREESALKFFMVFIDSCVNDIGDCFLALSMVRVRIAVWLIWLNLSGLGNALQSPSGVPLSYPLAMLEVTDWFDRQDLKGLLSEARMCSNYHLNTNFVHLLNFLLRLEIEFA
jgi:hypothetical protein